MLNFLKKRKILVTHSGSFHADDVFASAALSILMKKRKQSFKIIRTREKKIIEKGDYVFDIGGVYDPSKNRFDHHQTGGAGKRENVVPYSSFGLVWKYYGEEIAGSKEVADRIDRYLVQPIDAQDNGMDVFSPLVENVFPYQIGYAIGAFNPSCKEKEVNNVKRFKKALSIASAVLEREIIKIGDKVQCEKEIAEVYNQSKDKQIIVLDFIADRNDIWNALASYPEPLFIVFKNSEDNWRVVAMRKQTFSHESRKPMPVSWRGKREDLAEITGVSDAFFCHNTGFLASAKSKEGAIKLAQLALEK